MTYTDKQDGCFYSAHGKSLYPRRNKEVCEVPQVEKELAYIRSIRRRVAKSFASRGPEWLSPTKEEHDASLVSTLISCNVIRSQKVLVSSFIRENLNFACPKVISTAFVSNVCVIFS